MPTPPNGFPQQFGKYRLLRKLARGGMAELFLATEADQKRPVVIKRVLPHFTQDTEFLKMFLNEARIAALLNHPGIVHVFDLGKEEEHLFIAMEFVDGFDLETLSKLCGGRLPPPIAARVGADVCDALYYANRHVDLEGKPLNIVHRDVTPGNVMITRAGEVKLVDFGVAKAAAQLERTRPGVVKGKFRYMSPEQVTFKELDGRSDLFSLGVLLYEVTTGERPFERKQIIDIIRALTDWTPPDPTEAVKGYPKRLAEVIMRALEKDREKRFRNGREMQAALEQALLKTPTGKAELKAFIAELARAHPKEMAPVAPELELERAESAATVTPPAPPRRNSRPEIPDPQAGASLRTEAIPGNEVKRMIAEADRRAAARQSGQLPRLGVNTRASRGGLPVLPVGPPPEDEATALALGDEEEETTTTNPVNPRTRLPPAHAPRLSSGAIPRQPSGRPGPPVPHGSDLESGDDEGADGPSTERVKAVVLPPPSSSPSPRRSGNVPIPGELGSDDDLDSPTVSNVEGVSDRDVSGMSSITTSGVTEGSEISITANRRRLTRQLLLGFAALCLLATLVFLILTLLARPSTPDETELVDEGVELGSRKLPPPERVGLAFEGDEDGGAEPGLDGPAGTVAVDGAPGIRVSLGGRPFQEVPARFVLPAGLHRCQYIPRGSQKKKACSKQVQVEAGRQTSLHVP